MDGLRVDVLRRDGLGTETRERKGRSRSKRFFGSRPRRRRTSTHHRAAVGKVLRSLFCLLKYHKLHEIHSIIVSGLKNDKRIRVERHSQPRKTAFFLFFLDESLDPSQAPFFFLFPIDISISDAFVELDGDLASDNFCSSLHELIDIFIL